jgi:ribosomal RNA-processing protein 8
MFAVEGWKLGPVAAQTAPQKKLKRKRDDKEDAKGVGGETLHKSIRRNPFAMPDPKGTKQPTKNHSSKPPKETVSVSKKTTKNESPPEGPTEAPISKRQQARNRAAKRLERKLENQETQDEPQMRNTPHIEPLSTMTLTPLQQKMRAKLTGSQFRHINEKLYTTHSSEALSLFTEQPSLFHDVLRSIILLI